MTTPEMNAPSHQDGRSTERPRRRSPIVSLIATFALFATVAGCSDDDEATKDPSELANDVLTATRDGDVETWRGLYSGEAVTIFPDGTELATFGDAPFVIDDFDGDGVTSLADDLQARSVLHEPAGQTMTWECRTVAENQSECTVTATDGFLEAGGGAPLVTRARTTFEDDVVVTEEFLGPVDPAQMAASQETYFQELTAYESWVRDAHSDQYATTFHGPCCQGSMIMLPASIAEHSELMPEYFAGRS